MSWWNPFSWNSEGSSKKRAAYEFTDEDRRISAELRQKQTELKKLELQKEMEIRRLEADVALEELRMDLEELKESRREQSGSDSIEGMFADVLRPVAEAYADKIKLESKMKSHLAAGRDNVLNTTPPTNSNSDEFSDQQLLLFWEELSPFEKEMAKNSSDEKIRGFLINEFPDIKKENIDKIIKFVRQKEIST